MEAMKILSADRLVCMDGIHFNPKDNLEKYGWSEIGREAVVLQIFIESRCFAVHAAMTENGFIAWEIFEGNVCGTDVSNFITDKLAPVFGGNEFLLLDNAANQRTDQVISTMEISLGGRFVYNVEYSPELNPIERGFSLIRRWIRENEGCYVGNPIGLIQSSFFAYSIAGPFGDHCYNFFEFYRLNHSEFLNEI
jgi:transposase